MKHARTVVQSEQSLTEMRHIVQKWACLQCRVVIKMPHNCKPDAAPTCSRCQNHVFFAGKAFRAPRRSDEKGWRKVAVMLRSGYVFHPISLGYVPDNPNALPDWEQRKHEKGLQTQQESKSRLCWEHQRRTAKRRAKVKLLEREAREEERRNREAAAETL